MKNAEHIFTALRFFHFLVYYLLLIYLKKSFQKVFNNIFTKGVIIIICWVFVIVWGTYLFNFSVYPKLKELNGNKDLPEEIFGFKGDYFYDFLNKVGEAGQSNYLTFQLFDYVNWILLCFALFVTIYYLLNKLKARKLFNSLLFFPVALAFFEFLENTIFVYLLFKLPKRFVQISNAASDITSIKLIFGTITFLIVLICFLCFLFKIIFSKFKKQEQNN